MSENCYGIFRGVTITIAAYYLNPKFQYRPGVGCNPELLQAVHDIFSKLDPNAEGLCNFGN